MRTSSRVMIGMVAAAGMTAFLLSGRAGAQAPQAPRVLKIAILDMGDCLNPEKCGQAKSYQGELDAKRKEVNDEIVKMEAELKQMGEKLGVTAPGSELRAKLAFDANMLEHKLKVISELRRRQMTNLNNAYRNELYSNARKIATVIAGEQKIDLVLRGDDGAFEEEQNEMAAQKNVLRSVLYFEPTLDITVEVLKRLNDDFKKKNGQATCPTCKIDGKDGKCPKCGGPIKAN